MGVAVAADVELSRVLTTVLASLLGVPTLSVLLLKDVLVVDAMVELSRMLLDVVELEDVGVLLCALAREQMTAIKPTMVVFIFIAMAAGLVPSGIQSAEMTQSFGQMVLSSAQEEMMKGTTPDRLHDGGT